MQNSTTMDALANDIDHPSRITVLYHGSPYIVLNDGYVDVCRHRKTILTFIRQNKRYCVRGHERTLMHTTPEGKNVLFILRESETVDRCYVLSMAVMLIQHCREN